MERIEVIREGKKTTGHETLKEIGLEEGHTIEINGPEDGEVTQTMREGKNQTDRSEDMD